MPNKNPTQHPVDPRDVSTKKPGTFKPENPKDTGSKMDTPGQTSLPPK